MANEADQASESVELFLQVSLAAARTVQIDSPKPKGCCLNCSEPLELPRRWCDKDCMEDWEKVENSRRRASGRAILNTVMLADD